MRLASRDLFFLTLDIAGVFGLGLDLARDLLAEFVTPGARTNAGQGHQIRVGDVWPPKQIEKRVLTFELLAEDSLGILCRQQAGVNPGRPEALLLASDGLALEFERRPTMIIHEAEAAAGFAEAQIRIVLAQHQPELGAAGEHPVGLGYAAGDQIVDQDAQVSFIPPGAPWLTSPRGERGVQAGKQTLSGSLLVAGRAIDLAGKVKSANRLRLERGLQISRVEVVVLDRVAGSQDVRLFESLDRMDQVELNVERQTRRDSVRVVLVGRQPLGLEKDLMARFAGKAMNLVLY